jgi:hypothetical protein
MYAEPFAPVYRSPHQIRDGTHLAASGGPGLRVAGGELEIQWRVAGANYLNLAAQWRVVV